MRKCLAAEWPIRKCLAADWPMGNWYFADWPIRNCYFAGWPMRNCYFVDGPMRTAIMLTDQLRNCYFVSWPMRNCCFAGWPMRTDGRRVSCPGRTSTWGLTRCTSPPALISPPPAGPHSTPSPRYELVSFKQTDINILQESVPLTNTLQCWI